MLSSGLILRERYSIVRQIGKGGTSRVYLAKDTSIGKLWAIKCIEINDDDACWLAQNEINMMIRLDYETFPRIVDAWQENNNYYIVSDYVEGVSMDRLICDKQISKKNIYEWWLDIARALDYLHKCNPAILYLDLKLENIMIRPDNTIRLIDFGIAGRIASKGSLYGTPGYAAPEQFYNRGELLDERTDIFAFGMLMYAMYTGKRPDLRYDKQIELVRKNRWIPRKIKNIILTCISRDKSLRYRDMSSLIHDLKELGGNRSRIRYIREIAAAIIVTLGIIGGVAVKMVVAEPIDDVGKKLIEEAGSHIENGEYTQEGIRIICGYIDSGCLEEDVEQKFTYEVARNYFEVQKNYRDALRYFKQLNEERYPEAVYYIQLCQLQLSFEDDLEQYKKCLNEFYVFNAGMGYTDVRYDNELLIGTLFEGLLCSNENQRDEVIEFLLNSLSELRYAKAEGLYIDEEGKYEAEFLRRIFVLYSDNGDDDNAYKYGEEALQIMPESEKQAKEDIINRLKKLTIKE